MILSLVLVWRGQSDVCASMHAHNNRKIKYCHGVSKGGTGAFSYLTGAGSGCGCGSRPRCCDTCKKRIKNLRNLVL